MRNPDDENPLDPLDLFMSREATITPLSVNFDIVEGIKEFGEEHTFELLGKLKDMFA
jgi:hypothetical protein